MKLNKNVLISKYYKWIYLEYSEELPINFCDFFWNLLFAVLLFPMMMLTTGMKEHSICIRFLIGSFFIGGGLFILMLLWTYIESWINNTLSTLIRTGVVFGGIGLLILLVWGFVKTTSSDAGEIISEGFKSWKDKYCPKIDWKDE